MITSYHIWNRLSSTFFALNQTFLM